MKVSAVICCRNDNYGGHLIERATYSINSILDQVDELVYVDWNGENACLTDVIKIKDRSKLKTIIVTPEKCKELMGENYHKGQKMCEVLARNVGIRRASGDIIISTNPDIIFPERYLIDDMIKKLKENEMITLTREDVRLNDIFSQFKEDLKPEILPNIFGITSIKSRLMSPYLIMNKEIIENYTNDKHHALASLIQGCGDFQMAYKSMWFKIKGFEENTIKRFYTDTQVQYKVIMCGGTLKTSNFPPIYHIDHERDNSPHLLNSIEMVKTSINSDNWGFYNDLH